AWGIVAVYLLKGIGSYVSSYLMADVGQRVVMDLRNDLYRHILGQSAGFFAQGATGRLLSRISNDVGQVQQAVSETAGDLARSTLPPLMELIGGLGMAAALVYGSAQIADNRLTTGQFALFISTLFLMYGPAKKLSRVNANLQQAIAASERIFELLDTHSEVKERAGARPLNAFRRVIEFREVAFGYDEGTGRILKDVSFTVQAGQMIAIVGKSGAGKTTLVNLLPRFYDV